MNTAILSLSKGKDIKMTLADQKWIQSSANKHVHRHLNIVSTLNDFSCILFLLRIGIRFFISKMKNLILGSVAVEYAVAG